MTGKKIEFIEKPIKTTGDRYINDWVLGKTKEASKKIKRTTIYLPEELHRALKTKAAQESTSITEIIIKLCDNDIKY
ncbi:MAG: hypothetical protein EOP45_05950 [Sphingobacteriaceae bacterium]|nr:MAG: hypothetical protein EOP45_05950 [Sphingobacteriaceae bacterium]